MQEYIAPRLISKKGKTIVLSIYAVFTVACLLRLTDVRVFFSTNLFVNKGFSEFTYL